MKALCHARPPARGMTAATGMAGTGVPRCPPPQPYQEGSIISGLSRGPSQPIKRSINRGLSRRPPPNLSRGVYQEGSIKRGPPTYQEVYQEGSIKRGPPHPIKTGVYQEGLPTNLSRQGSIKRAPQPIKRSLSRGAAQTSQATRTS
eukprot:364962-Chlamydomonas_euryale.AAC.5